MPPVPPKALHAVVSGEIGGSQLRRYNVHDASADNLGGPRPSPSLASANRSQAGLQRAILSSASRRLMTESSLSYSAFQFRIEVNPDDSRVASDCTPVPALISWI